MATGRAGATLASSTTTGGSGEAELDSQEDKHLRARAVLPPKGGVSTEQGPVPGVLNLT
jgi:hypothetical protein